VEFFNAILEGEIHLSWELPSEAPTFGGWLGRNDHKIDPKYMLQPVDAAKLTAGDKPEVSAPAKPVRKKTAPKVEIAPSAKPQTALEDTIQKYTPRNIMFEQSKSIMLQGSLAEMDRLADMLKRYPNLHVSVEGHTDNIGDSVKNQKLSEERAAAVAAYLVHAGIASDRVSSKGFGGSRPLTQEKTAEGHARNRRVEFVIK
jgi:outer membrane protein OmpA-like peptidoglycan-associated protein